MRKPEMDQFFTPAWAAHALITHFYPQLSNTDRVLEPACGDGRFLMAIPDHVDAAGIEIDPHWAATARRNTGRDVVAGDALEVVWPINPTLIVGNPPFQWRFVQSLLNQAYEVMDYGGQVGLLIPAYMFQTAGTVVELSRRYSLSQTMVPRNLFPGLEKPLMWAQFNKERTRVMTGLFLYSETDAILRLAREYRCLFIGNSSRVSAWGEAVERALVALGGEADLQSLYQEIEGHQPTPNPWWKAQIRKICQSSFRRVGRGRYALDLASPIAA